jgi:hypothetical protein
VRLQQAILYIHSEVTMNIFYSYGDVTADNLYSHEITAQLTNLYCHGEVTADKLYCTVMRLQYNCQSLLSW